MPFRKPGQVAGLHCASSAQARLDPLSVPAQAVHMRHAVIRR